LLDFFQSPALALFGTTPRDVAADDTVDVDRPGGLYGGGVGGDGDGAGVGGASPPARSYMSSSIGVASTAAGAGLGAGAALGAGTMIRPPHLGHLPFLPAAASGALKRAPQPSHVTGMGIALRYPHAQQDTKAIPYVTTIPCCRFGKSCYNEASKDVDGHANLSPG
jgi:hypothetical protein